MTNPVIAVALDGPNMDLLEQWLSTGLLPTLRSLMQGGCTGRHIHNKRYRNDRCWDILLSGRDIDSVGAVFNPKTYSYHHTSSQRESRYSPFYALGDGFKTCVFDLPATLSTEVDGIQVFGWGSELNASFPVSAPASLIGELQEMYGTDPKLTRSVKIRDHNTQETENSYIVPNLYSESELQIAKANLLTSIERRTSICLDLLSREHWDLFLVNFSEPHTANHLLWPVSGTEPPNPVLSSVDAMLDVFKGFDSALNQLVKAAPNDATIVVYTIDNTGPNTMDVPSMAMLPELLYRWSNPSEALLTTERTAVQPPPPSKSYDKLWKHEIWALVNELGKVILRSPYDLEAERDPFSWHPAMWYRPLWGEMRAFALPSVSDGYIRLNLKGREKNGVVEIDDYDSTLESICEMLGNLTDARTGKLAVESVSYGRSSPFDRPDIPPDLIVSWNREKTIDCIESLELGRIGPLPYFRSGGHLPHGSDIEGLFIAKGPGIPEGETCRSGKLEDVPATILTLVGAPANDQMAGSSLFDLKSH